MIVVFSKIKAKLDMAARVILASFIATFFIRTLIWVLVLFNVQEETGSYVLEFMVAVAGHIIVLGLYYFIFEMQLAILIIESKSVEDF